MDKATIQTPLYISVAWILMTTYQLFTQIAVTAVVKQISLFSSSVGTWLAARIDMMIFISAFAWVFILSSTIPSLILGKQRSVLVQFLVVLALTLSAFIIHDSLTAICQCQTIDEIIGISALLDNPVLAAIYLSIPYVFMFTLDILSKRKKEADTPQDTAKDSGNIETIE